MLTCHDHDHILKEVLQARLPSCKRKHAKHVCKEHLIEMLRANESACSQSIL